MRIGLIAPVFLPLISGASLYCFELARALASLGHDVHVFTPPNGQDDPCYTLHPILSECLPDDIEPLLSCPMDVWHSLYFVYAPMASHVQPFFVTVHGDDAFSFFVPYRLPLRRYLNSRLLWRLTPGFRQQIDRLLDVIERVYDKKLANYSLKHVKQIITVSSFTKERVLNEYAFSSGKITVIPPGVSERFFYPSFDSPSTRKDNCFNLLTVTRLDDSYRIKNVHGVITALSRLKDRYNFEYSIVSGTVAGNYRAELINQVESLGLQKHVKFVSRLTDEELVERYLETDLFILASYAEPANFEGFGIVFLEANASGVPVLTTRTGGMSDYVVDGQNGLYADDPSAEAISRSLIRFFENEVTFDKQKLRSFAEPYRWKNIASRIIDLYNMPDS